MPLSLWFQTLSWCLFIHLSFFMDSFECVFFFFLNGVRWDLLSVEHSRAKTRTLENLKTLETLKISGWASELLVLRAEVVLLLPHVPVQTLGKALKPVVDRVPETDGRNREAGSGDGDTVEEECKRRERGWKDCGLNQEGGVGGMSNHTEEVLTSDTATQLPPEATIQCFLRSSVWLTAGFRAD